MLYNKSVLHIIMPQWTDAAYAWALLAVLNSRLASFWLTHCGKKTQRSLFPKLVKDDLTHLPLPKNFSQHIAVLAPAAKALSAQVKADTPHDEIQRLQLELDDRIYSLYELSDEHRKVLTACR